VNEPGKLGEGSASFGLIDRMVGTPSRSMSRPRAPRLQGQKPQLEYQSSALGSL